jgi:hypothetical protein
MQKNYKMFNLDALKRLKIGLIIETKEYEKAWNAFRYAVTAKKQGHETKVFLIGEDVECEGLTHDKYNVDEQLKNYVNSGGEILACGTCIKSRHLEDSLEVCHISAMVDCLYVVVWADKKVTF